MAFAITKTPLIRATKEGRRMMHLLSALAKKLAEAKGEYNTALASGASYSVKKNLAELHYLRLEQFRRVDQILNPAAQLKRERLLNILKIKWPEGKGHKTKNVSLDLDAVLTESVCRGDYLEQILYVADVGKREFSRLPIPGNKGILPLWIKEWEDSDYDLNFMPESFSDWAGLEPD